VTGPLFFSSAKAHLHTEVWSFRLIFADKKIVVYINGSNFYFSVKKAFNYKVDIEKFCKKLVKEN